MRAIAIVLVVVSAAVIGLPARIASAQPRTTPTTHTPRSAEDLARARALDQQGARAYGDGRYNDAIRYFEESYRLGGPPFELWNIAKCYVRLDQPEQAAEMLERYLTTPTLAAEDRDEATQQLEALRRRPSMVTIATSPSGADVTVDGKPTEGGRTPTTFVVAPGPHTLVIRLPSHAIYTRQLDARYGRAIILDLPLARENVSVPPERPPPVREDRPVALRVDVGVMLPRYGSLGGAAQPAVAASGTYRLGVLGGTTFGAGAMLSLTHDAWSTTSGESNSAAPCGVLTSPTSATALSLFAMGTAGWDLASRLRARALLGAGVAGYFADDLGGDVFVAACHPAPGPRPAVALGGRVEYAISPLVQLSATPLLLQLQPSFEGTRSAPRDTSGVWLRAIVAIGIGVDL